MPATVEVQVFGEPVIRRRLLRVEHNLLDASEAFARIARILEDAVRKNYYTAGQASGPRWPGLRPATIARKRRLGLDLRILRATHRLMDSLLERTDDEHVEDIGPDSLLWGSTVPYGVYHQSRRPRTVIPFRPPVRLPERHKREAVRELQKFIMAGGPT
jgi:phage gpG-like protein